MTKIQHLEISIPKTYQYSIRLKPTAHSVLSRIFVLVRQMEAEQIALLKQTYNDYQAFLAREAGQVALTLLREIKDLQQKMLTHRTPENTLLLSNKWTTLNALLKKAEQSHKTTVDNRYVKRMTDPDDGILLGLCNTYIKRGLPTFTANEIMKNGATMWERAIRSQTAPMVNPRKRVNRDHITFPFPANTPSSALLDQSSDLLSISHKKAKYLDFSSSFGTSTPDLVEGTIGLHRPVPNAATLLKLLFVREQRADREHFFINVVFKEHTIVSTQKPRDLLAVVLNWQEDGKSNLPIISIIDTNNPKNITHIFYPAFFKEEYEVLKNLKTRRMTLKEGLKHEIELMPLTGDKEIDRAIQSMQRLHIKNITPNTLQRLATSMITKKMGLPAWLSDWRIKDRILWQGTTGKSQKLSEHIRIYYHQLAKRFTQTYGTIITNAPPEYMEPNNRNAIEFKVNKSLIKFMTELKYQCLVNGSAFLREEAQLPPAITEEQLTRFAVDIFASNEASYNRKAQQYYGQISKIY